MNVLQISYKAAMHQLAWELALQASTLKSNPAWEPATAGKEDLLEASVKIHHTGETVTATGNTSNEVFQNLRDQILIHIGQSPVNNKE